MQIAPNEAVARKYMFQIAPTASCLLKNALGHPHRDAWHSIGHRFRQRFHLADGEDDGEDQDIYPRPPTGSCRVQCVRSVSDWSHGILTEHSIQNACKCSQLVVS